MLLVMIEILMGCATFLEEALLVFQVIVLVTVSLHLTMRICVLKEFCSMDVQN